MTNEDKKTSVNISTGNPMWKDLMTEKYCDAQVASFFVGQVRKLIIASLQQSLKLTISII